MTDSIKRLKELVGSSDNIVFFGGAGVSTESGIPDFRSTGGLYHQEWKYPPEVILSHTFYESNPEEFFRFYRAKLLAPDAKPNAAHKKLAEWEAEGRLKAVGEHGAHAVHRAQQEHEDIELLRVEVQGGQLEVKVPQAEQQRHAQIDERPREGVANGLAGLPLPLGTLGLGGVPAAETAESTGVKASEVK